MFEQNNTSANKGAIFIGVIIVFFIIQVIQRLFLSPTLSVDEAEQLILSQVFSLGYNEQPPLYTWFQIIFLSLFKNDVLAVSVLKNLLLCLTFIYYYKLARLTCLSDVKAIAATLGLYLVPQIFWEAKVDQTHSVIVTMAAVVMMYNFVRIFKGDQSSFRFIALGVSCGIGVLSKYNFVLLLTAAFVPLVFLDSFRKKILNKNILFSFLSFLLVVFPHCAWFVRHASEATQSTVERIHQSSVLDSSRGMVGGLLDLLVSSVTFTALLCVVWFFLCRKNMQTTIDTECKKYFSLLFVSVYTLLLAVIIFLEISSIKERWLLPYLVFFPLYLTLFTHKDILQRKNSLLAWTCAAIAIISAGAYLAVPRLVDVTKHPSRIQTPFVKLKPQFDQVFHLSNEANVYAVNYFIGGNIRHLFPEKTVITKEREVMLNEHTRLLLFYDKGEPPILKKLEQLNYQCDAGEIRSNYLNSDEIEYTLKYQHCRKTS